MRHVGERVAPAHPQNECTRTGEVHSVPKQEEVLILRVLVVCTYLRLVPWTHLESMIPKLNTMSHQTYGTVQLPGGTPSRQKLEVHPKSQRC